MIVMWVMAIAEFVLSISAAVVLGAAYRTADTHAINIPLNMTTPLGSILTAVDSKERILMLIGGSVGLSVVSLISLVTIATYFGVLRDLRRDGGTPIKRSGTCLATTMRMFVIIVSVIGFVAVCIAISMTGSASMIKDYLAWGSDAAKNEEDLARSLRSGWALNIVVLVLKLAETMLGHAWAITLKRSHENKLATMPPMERTIELTEPV